MPAPTTPMPISPDAQDCVINYLESAVTAYSTNYSIRSQLEARDRAYYRTEDQTSAHLKAKAANKAGDASKIQNVTVPVVMPQVETELSYLQEVFLTGYPIFGTVAPPAQAEAMMQMDTIVGENSVRAGWPLELLKAMRDGLKYDISAVEVVWENRKLFTIGTPEDTNISQGTPTETYYQGNFIKRLDMYNVILDTRVDPEKIHTEGEFAGYTEQISRIELKKRMEDLPPLGTMNFRKAFESPSPDSNTSDNTGGYYQPSINPEALLPVENRKDFNWMGWAELTDSRRPDSISYKTIYDWTVLYARILPADFKLNTRNKNHVQIWKFIIINHKVVIFAERQTNAHNYLPIIIGKPTADGMGYQSRSFAENVEGIQSVASSIINSGLESQRRKVYDRMFYDPSRINKKDIDMVSAVARVPVKSSGYGKTMSDAVYQVPYRDDGVAETVSMSQTVAQMGDIINGQNRVSQGQFQKGNKTRKEFDTVMGNQSSRSRMRALALEYSFFVPIKEIIKSNILQYQPPTSLINRDTKAVVQIDPSVLRKAIVEFSMSDGYLPSDKMVGAETFGTMIQAAQAMPEVRAEYDIVGAFIYSQQLQGANWLPQFKRSDEDKKAYLAQMQAAAAVTGPGAPPAAKPSGA